MRLRLIEEVVCAPQASGPGEPDREEAEERLLRAVERRDTEAENAAFVDRMRAEVREGWKDFPERRLLADLYRRAALRRQKGRPRDSMSRHNSRRPTHEAGLRIASALVAGIAAAARFDFAWESEAVSIVLADQWASLDGKRRRAALSVYINYSKSSRVYFDAVRRTGEKSHNQGEPIPRPLARWRAEAADGLRRPPARNPLPPHRPAKPAQLREVKIRIAIEVLRSVGVPPMGTPVSGCGFVAEALDIPEGTVTRIWKRPFEAVLRQQMKATAGRNGPFHTTEA